MCGLVGIAGDLSYADEATFKRLLIYDYFRGTDSTGMAALRISGEVKMAKIASHPVDLFDSKRFQDALSGYASLAFIGHNRAATKGKVNGANAHPYAYGHIIGAHNGTLDLASWKRLNEALGYDTDVDSQAIFACIEKIGVEETVKLMQKGRTYTEGAWALSWIDTTDNSLNFVRNEHRPLWYAYTEDFKRVLWASEWPMLDAATKLSAQGYKLYHDKDFYRFWEMEEDKHYKFDLAEFKAGSSERPNPIVGDLKGREPAPVQSAATGTPPFYPHAQNGNVTTMGTPPHQYAGSSVGGTRTSTTNSRGKMNTLAATTEMIEIPTCPSEPLGAAMSKGRFQEIAQYGCSWCGKRVEYGDPGISIFDKTHHILCAEHSDNRGNTRIYTTPGEIRAVADYLDELAKVA